MVEYAENKLFMTGRIHMFLIFDWKEVVFIPDPNLSNTYKLFAFPVPDFDEEKNPFIAVCGETSLNLLNVKNR